MRTAVFHTIRAMRAAVLLALVLALICIGIWYGGQLLEGNDARAELESRWQDSLASPAPLSFNPGDVVGRIVVPRIGLDAPLVEMADVDDRANLNKGPAHLAGSAYPGQAGNCVIAGHRTTYARPFFSLDTMQAGDEIIVIDLGRNAYTYRVSQVLIVDPADVWVMDATPEPSVTLIACHPLFSARNRIVIKALLEA